MLRVGVETSRNLTLALRGCGAGFRMIPCCHWALIRGDCVAAAVEMRNDYSAETLRQLAVKAKDANQARRLLALAAVRAGKNREEAALVGGMDRQTLRDWVHAFNERGPDGLVNG